MIGLLRRRWATVRRVWASAVALLRARTVWRLPRRSAVLIWDAQHPEALRSLLAPWHPETLPTRGEAINVPVALAALLLPPWRSRYIYRDRYIARVRPRVVVTLHDNDVTFYDVARRHPGVRTLLIQNGVRTHTEDLFDYLPRIAGRRQPFAVTRLLTFGSAIGAEYARWIQGTVTPVGSLLNNAAPRRRATEPGTVTFISQYSASGQVIVEGVQYAHDDYYVQADRFVLTCLVTFATRRGLRVRILPRYRQADDADHLSERRYYEQLLGPAAAFVEGCDRGAGYDAVDAAEMTVSIDSTLGYESMARGNRTAMFPVRLAHLGARTMPFGWPVPLEPEGPFWTCRQDPATVERILDRVLSMSDLDYGEALRVLDLDAVLHHDPGNTTLAGIFRDELNTPEGVDQP